MLQLIIAIVSVARRHAWPVILSLLVLAGLGLFYTSGHLRVDTDTNNLFAKNLPWRQAQIREDKDFPQFNNLIVAVVRAKTPEEASETAQALNGALQQDHTYFIDSRYPAGSAFYADEGLLLLPVDKLASLLTSIVSAQPLLGQLAADPSARGLFDGLALIATGVKAGANIAPYTPALRTVEQNLQADADGHPEPLSWQSLISSGLGGQGPDFVLIHPKLHPGTLQPGGIATQALVQIAKTLPDVKSGRATVNYTGQIPLSDEQFASLTQGLVVGGLVSLALIALWLFLALRSWRLILPILATLVLGLVLTVSFAAVFIGVINLISVAFMILFIGLAVDFGIQFGVRLRDVRRHVPDFDAALPETARQAGGQIALAATATACGFFAFSPTPFTGVAELGTIAGAGMFIAFLCTIIFLPALLALTRPGGEGEEVGLPFGPQADGVLRRHRRVVLAVCGVVALAGMASAATLGFDANPLNTKDPNTESMRTLHKLLADPATNPFYADALVPNLADAKAMATKLAALPAVAGAISGATFVPDDQQQKLGMLAQAQTILAPTLLAAKSPPPPQPDAQAIRASIAKAQSAIEQVASKLPKDSPLLAMAKTLQQLQDGSDTTILDTNAALTRFLPQELKRLADSLSPHEITVQNLPKDVASDWFLPDGQVRVEAFPSQAAQNTAGLRKFARQVQAIAPNAGGPAISTIATAETILHSFREAALLAIVAIAVILLVVFRNLRDTLLVLATLALSAMLTALFAKMDGLMINYANIIALPLLLGVGVSFNVYFVMNFRDGMQNFLSSATARAVLFSALTTGTAFGSLAASHDRGTASMGVLLLLSLAAVLIATFIFLPALLYTLRDARKAQP